MMPEYSGWDLPITHEETPIPCGTPDDRKICDWMLNRFVAILGVFVAGCFFLAESGCIQ